MPKKDKQGQGKWAETVHKAVTALLIALAMLFFSAGSAKGVEIYNTPKKLNELRTEFDQEKEHSKKVAEAVGRIEDSLEKQRWVDSVDREKDSLFRVEVLEKLNK